MKKLTAKIAFEGQPAWVKCAMVAFDGRAFRSSSYFISRGSETAPLQWLFKQDSKQQNIGTGFDSTEFWDSAIYRDFNQFPAPDDNKTIAKKDDNVVKELPNFESGLFEDFLNLDYFRVDLDGRVFGFNNEPVLTDTAWDEKGHLDDTYVFIDEMCDASNWKTWKLDRVDYEEWLKQESEEFKPLANVEVLNCKNASMSDMDIQDIADLRSPLSNLKINNTNRKHSHYFKDVSHLSEIDVYQVCELFNVEDASGAKQHAIKKLLCSGQRGYKDERKDLQEVIDTLQRKLELMAE